MTEREKMLAGELYDANFDPAILKERMDAEVLTWEFNSLRPDDPRKNELLRQIMGELREGVTVLSPVYFDYGSLTKLGSGTFVNHGCYFMDGGSITIGGKKIAPEELEAKLMMYPGIREVLVSGDGESREIVAEIYADIQEAQVHSIVQSMNRVLPVYMRVKRILIRKSPFPRTASGKIELPRRQPRKSAGNRQAFLWFAGAGVFAILVFAAEIVLSGFAYDNQGGSGLIRMLLSLSESVGDLLLVAMAIVTIFWACKFRRGR